MTEPYRVNHHLIQMVYFDDNQSLPCGADYAQLWESLQQLGSHRISGAFWNAMEPFQPSKAKLRRLTLGSPQVFEPLRPTRDTPIFGGGADVRKNAARLNCDSDFYLDLTSDSRCPSGFTPPNFQLAISDNWRRQIANNVLLQMLKNNFEILDLSSPFYGFIDIDRPDETFAGHMYTALGCGNAPLSRFVDRAQWLRSVSLKRDQARSIYWGNYFGPRLLEKLGGRSVFLDAYVEQGQRRDGSPSVLIWEFANGVFLSLCREPDGCLPGEVLEHSAEWNMQWLFKRLCDADAIIGS